MIDHIKKSIEINNDVVSVQYIKEQSLYMINTLSGAITIPEHMLGMTIDILQHIEMLILQDKRKNEEISFLGIRPAPMPTYPNC